MPESKLKPFEHLFSELNDEQLAEMAGVQPATVARYRKSLGDQASDNAAVNAGETSTTNHAASDANTNPTPASDSEARRAAEERGKAEERLVVAAMAAYLSAHTDEALIVAHGVHPDDLAQARARLAEEQAALTSTPAPRTTSAPPLTVRAVKRGRVRGPDGRTMRVGRRDVYSGEMAAWLWTHHRKLVEPYPPRA